MLHPCTLLTCSPNTVDEMRPLAGQQGSRIAGRFITAFAKTRGTSMLLTKGIYFFTVCVTI